MPENFFSKIFQNDISSLLGKSNVMTVAVASSASPAEKE